VHMNRLRRALAWAVAHSATGPAKWRLALALLANHGRFVADEMLLGAHRIDDLRRDTAVTGAQHLDGLAGAILLGFHLGPPRTAFILRALGYPVRFAGRLETSRGDARWAEALEAAEAVALPAGTPRERAQGLHRIRNLLQNGALVYIAADGPFGQEAFRLDVPGGSVVVRRGWLALRQHTRVPTLPVFAYRSGGRRVITVHPPLPAPDGHPKRDAALCQAALSPLVQDYVRRFPSQCRYVAIPPW
jgi:lauroyl/myristoyl acyltransferase